MKRIKLTILFITMTLLGFHTNPETCLYEKAKLPQLNIESINCNTISTSPLDTNTDFTKYTVSEFGQVSVISLENLSDLQVKSNDGVNFKLEPGNTDLDSSKYNSRNFLKYSFAN